MAALTDDDSRSDDRHEGDVDEGVSEIVVGEVGAELVLQRLRRGGEGSREQSRRQERVGDDEQNRGREEEEGDEHGGEDEHGLHASQRPSRSLLLGRERHHFLPHEKRDCPQLNSLEILRCCCVVEPRARVLDEIHEANRVEKET